MRFVQFVALPLVLLNCDFGVCLYYADPCVIEKNGKVGICKYYSECEEAIRELQLGHYPQICGFEGSKSIVCCVQKGDLKEPPPKPKPTRKPGEISLAKCKEYSQYVWVTEPSYIGIPDEEDTVRYDCPFDKIELIVGGTEATAQEFPHMAHIGYQGEAEIMWFCGGSLISEQFVLTAAHCLTDRNWGEAKYVRVGFINVDDLINVQQFEVADRIKHPDYVLPAHYNDIGLLKLHKAVELNSFARPACLHYDNRLPDSKVIASGWGRLGTFTDSSKLLLKVVLELFSQPECNQTFKRLAGKSKLKDGIRDDVMICAGSRKIIGDTCEGDSGGPLQVYKEETKDIKCMYDILGITSFGQACGLAPNVPGVYTRVSRYIQWIEDKVWPP